MISLTAFIIIILMIIMIPILLLLLMILWIIVDVITNSGVEIEQFVIKKRSIEEVANFILNFLYDRFNIPFKMPLMKNSHNIKGNEVVFERKIVGKGTAYFVFKFEPIQDNVKIHVETYADLLSLSKPMKFHSWALIGLHPRARCNDVKKELYSILRSGDLSYEQHSEKESS